MGRRTDVYVIRRDFPHEWSTGLCSAPCDNCCCWIASCVCFPCANYSIRSKALGDMRHYRFFQGYACGVCGCCCEPCESTCGSCCLCAEVLLCPHLSVMATRHFIQDKYAVRNTGCEDCCIDCVIGMECLLCCFPEDSIVHEALHCAVHLCMCIGMPCMQVQHHEQLKREMDGQALLRPEYGQPPGGHHHHCRVPA